jgi:SAM-dependent methyltransferase
MLNSPRIEHQMNLRRVARFLCPRPDERVLEIGCSRGYLTRLVQRFAPRTRGVDLNAEAIGRGVTHGLSVMDAQRLKFDDESFDKVFSFHCIEHVPDLGAALREMDRVLRPGGSLLLVYPAEPIRGLYVIPTAWMLFGNPLRARELHLHRLTPRRLQPFLAGTSLTAVESRFDLFVTPQFITVLRKAARPVRCADLPAGPPVAALGRGVSYGDCITRVGRGTSGRVLYQRDSRPVTVWTRSTTISASLSAASCATPPSRQSPF